MDPEVIKDIRQRIETNDLEGALAHFREHATGTGTQRKLSVLANRLSRIREQETLGLAGPEEARRETNQVVFALLSLLEKPGADENGTGRRGALFLLMPLAVLLAALACAYYLGLFSDGAGEVWRGNYEVVREFSEGRAAVFAGRWGYVDEQGMRRIPLIYEEAADFAGGKARVKLEGKYFYLDQEGACVQDCAAEDKGSDAMKVEFNGNNNQAIDARGGEVIINEKKE